MKAWRSMMAWMLAMALAWALMAPMAMAESYKDGSYNTLANCKSGEIKVEIVIKDGKIKQINTSDIEDEDDNKAINTLVKRVLENQSASVSGVYDAKETTEAFLGAVEEILESASGSQDAETDSLFANEKDIIPQLVIEVDETIIPDVAKPEITFDQVHSVEGEVSYIEGEDIRAYWSYDENVEEYHIQITDPNGDILQDFSSRATKCFMPKDELIAGDVYTLYLVAIPKNGTYDNNGVSSSAKFALYVHIDSGDFCFVCIDDISVTNANCLCGNYIHINTASSGYLKV
jgi:uncharacterized protein with FMN-binding domain